MVNRVIIALSVLAFSSSIFAETCPTVKDIRHNNIAGWKLYDSDDDTLLSTKRENHFKQAAIQFVLAESAKNKANKLSIHCFYRDQSGSNLDAYLSKDNFSPKKSNHDFWYQVSGHMHCAAGEKQCEFENKLLNKKYLAKK